MEVWIIRLLNTNSQVLGVFSREDDIFPSIKMTYDGMRVEYTHEVLTPRVRSVNVYRNGKLLDVFRIEQHFVLNRADHL